MLRIRLLSDLHMETYRFDYEYKGEDVVVLAGDIDTHCNHNAILDAIPDHIPVLFVAGNHEYYDNDFDYINQRLRVLEKDHKNFHFLNNESITIDDVEFFGGVMFSDFKVHNEIGNPVAMAYAKQAINDFRVIYIDKPYIKWKPENHLEQHKVFKHELNKWLLETNYKKRCVISHFVPSTQCIHPKWQDSPINPYFTSDMEQYMGWEGLWLFGHTHDSHDIMVGDTRLVCNPKGYGGENWRGFNPDLILTI